MRQKDNDSNAASENETEWLKESERESAFLTAAAELNTRAHERQRENESGCRQSKNKEKQKHAQQVKHTPDFALMAHLIRFLC